MPTLATKRRGFQPGNSMWGRGRSSSRSTHFAPSAPPTTRSKTKHESIHTIWKEVVPGHKPVLRDTDTSGLSDVTFGKPIREAEFLLMPGVAHLNHGSYGTVPRRVLDVQTRYNEERERHPDMWFRINAKHYLDSAVQQVADFVNVDWNQLKLVQNATQGINTVVKSYPFQAGDAILDTTWTYGSVHLMCEDVSARMRPDVQKITLDLAFPISGPDDVIARFKEALEKHPEIKIVIIDHITSPGSVVLPVKQLVSLCHAHGALALVDGAHAVGQIPLDLQDLGADFYTSNLHKWCYAPRGCAFLYHAPKHSWLHPLHTSWQLHQSLDKQFFDQGTRDHVPNICARNALQFYQACGGLEKITAYTSGLAAAAKQLLTEELGLPHLDIPHDMEAPNLKLIKLPEFRDFPPAADTVWPLWQAMFASTDVFGILVYIEGAIYFRYSVNIYNDMDDIRAAVRMLKDFIHKHKL